MDVKYVDPSSYPSCSCHRSDTIDGRVEVELLQEPIQLGAITPIVPGSRQRRRYTYLEFSPMSPNFLVEYIRVVRQTTSFCPRYEDIGLGGIEIRQMEVSRFPKFLYGLRWRSRVRRNEEHHGERHLSK